MAEGHYRNFAIINKEFLKFEHCVNSGENKCIGKTNFDICYGSGSLICAPTYVGSSFYETPFKNGWFKPPGAYKLTIGIDCIIYERI